MAAGTMALSTSIDQTKAINPRLIAMTGTLATFMELLDTTIANVSLPHIAGGLPTSYDLTAFNDALIPLLGFGPRIHPELDLMFVSNPDRTVPTILLGEDLKTIWQETSQLLWTEFVKLSVANRLQKHGAVSEEDFLREPHRNRFTVLLGRTGISPIT